MVGWLVNLSTIGCFVVTSSLIGYFRVVYVAGRDGNLPELLSFVHVRFLTPMPSIIFTVSKRLDLTMDI